MIKYWNALTDEAQNAILIVGVLFEAWFLFGVLI